MKFYWKLTSLYSFHFYLYFFIVCKGRSSWLRRVLYRLIWLIWAAFFTISFSMGNSRMSIYFWSNVSFFMFQFIVFITFPRYQILARRIQLPKGYWFMYINPIFILYIFWACLDRIIDFKADIKRSSFFRWKDSGLFDYDI